MHHFTNESINIDHLPKYQETVLEKLHPKYKIVLSLSTLITMVLALIIAFFLLSIQEGNSVSIKEEVYIGIVLFSGIFISINLWSFKKKGYILREKDLIYQHGILSTTTTIIPLNRIQHMAVNEGVISRILGLAALEVFTAGGNSSDLRIPGIERERAYRLKEYLTQSINQKTDNLPEKPQENL